MQAKTYAKGLNIMGTHLITQDKQDNSSNPSYHNSPKYTPSTLLKLSQ